MSRSSPWQCHLVNMLNHDLKTSVDVYASLSWWILGYQDRAARLSDKAVAHARRRGHPFDLGWVLYMGAEAFEYRCEPEKVRLRAEECERLGRDNSMPVLWAMGAPLRHGLALIREGRAAEGIPPLKAGMAFWDSLGGECWSPHRNSVLAEGMALTCDLDNALRLIDEQIAQVERPAGKNAFTAPRSCGSKAGCSRSRVTSKALSGTISPRSTGRASSRRSSGNCARQPASRDCGQARAGARRRMNCSRQSTTGSP